MGNDLRIYDDLDSWWDDKNPRLKPLRRLAPARARYLSKEIIPKGRVLDLGCGGGYMLETLSKQDVILTGVDLAQQALIASNLRGAEKGYEPNPCRADGRKLPFRTASFDGVVCTDVLVHVPEPDKVLAEVSRVLKPQGWLLVSAINQTWIAKFIMVWLAENMLKLVPKGTHDARTFIKPKWLKKTLDTHGLDCAPFEGIGPVGWSGGSFIFGRHPSCSVMYQALAFKRDDEKQASLDQNITHLETTDGCFQLETDQAIE